MSAGANGLRGLAIGAVGLVLAGFYGWVSFARSGDVEIRSFPSSVFRMDVFRAPRDWATDLPSGRTSVHPLTKLALTPVGLAVRRHVPFAGTPVDAARLLALFGVALGAVLSGLLAARLAGGSVGAGVVAALVAGTSFSSVLLAAIPESASLACVSTLAPLVFLRARAGKPWSRAEFCLWIALGLLGIAITVTQLVHWAIALGFRLWGLRRETRAPTAAVRVGLGAALLALVLGLATAGSWLQAERYPGSRKFYEVAAVAADESAFLRTDAWLGEPGAHVARVATHFVGVNFVAPFPERSDALMRELGTKYWILSVESPWRAECAPGQIALALATGLALLLAAFALARGGGTAAFLPAALSVASMFGLHLLYGHEYLLYAGHWHGVIVALGVAAVWRAWPRRHVLSGVAAIALSFGLAANSTAVLDRVYGELAYGLQAERRGPDGSPRGALPVPAHATPRSR